MDIELIQKLRDLSVQAADALWAISAGKEPARKPMELNQEIHRLRRLVDNEILVESASDEAGAPGSSRISELRFGIPVWCHHHCTKMRVVKLLPGCNMLILGSSASKVRITRVAQTVDEGWNVEWEIAFSQQTKVNGKVVLSSEELESAFGLSNKPGWMGENTLDRFGGDVASHGKFIRWADYLNIPCPGTGNDGDPNVSIRLSAEIKDAVKTLLPK